VVPVPSVVVEPSENVTISPSGTVDGDTVDENVTTLPAVDGLADENSLVVVVILFTVCVNNVIIGLEYPS
jgi:hypothetical protein